MHKVWGFSICQALIECSAAIRSPKHTVSNSTLSITIEHHCRSTLAWITAQSSGDDQQAKLKLQVAFVVVASPNFSKLQHHYTLTQSAIRCSRFGVQSYDMVESIQVFAFRQCFCLHLHVLKVV